jgi:hypothetical protein
LTSWDLGLPPALSEVKKDKRAGSPRSQEKNYIFIAFFRFASTLSRKPSVESHF